MGNASKVKTNVRMKSRPSLDHPRMGTWVKVFDKKAAAEKISRNLSARSPAQNRERQ